jgi:hypothetical protein
LAGKIVTINTCDEGGEIILGKDNYRKSARSYLHIFNTITGKFTTMAICLQLTSFFWRCF